MAREISMKYNGLHVARAQKLAARSAPVAGSVAHPSHAPLAVSCQEIIENDATPDHPEAIKQALTTAMVQRQYWASTPARKAV